MSFYNKYVGGGKQSRQQINDMDILDILDPDATGFIDCEDIKALRGNLPEKLQDKVAEILKNFVFEFRSFRMPCDLFMEYYKPASNSRKKTPRKVSCTLNSLNSTRKSLDSSSDNLFRTTSIYKTSIMSSNDSVGARRSSLSPKKIRTYTELYEKKKENEKQTFQRSSLLFDKIDQKLNKNRFFSQGSFIENNSVIIHHKSFATKFANVEALMEIRRQHLRYSSMKS
ncbi:unnamed protein product [Blepharisma stoltei]|uniref:EF-hand domain-containing protein n=1 Tax=Blepharisma stoltei TaxID=1481888 RepID=A0AAU9IPW2_9CILI|nr:unnamed protein product [Blepharisma stoltei]